MILYRNQYIKFILWVCSEMSFVLVVLKQFEFAIIIVVVTVYCNKLQCIEKDEECLSYFPIMRMYRVHTLKVRNRTM